MRHYHGPQEVTFAAMIEVKPESCGEAGVTMFWLRPNRALNRRGMWVLGSGLVAAAMLMALLGAHAGNVFAPLFALLESAIVAVALLVSWRRGGRSERIRLDAEVLEVQTHPGHHCTRFQSGWVRVWLQQGSGRQHLLLASHGRQLEIGAFLVDSEREALREKLNTVLRGLKASRS